MKYRGTGVFPNPVRASWPFASCGSAPPAPRRTRGHHRPHRPTRPRSPSPEAAASGSSWSARVRKRRGPSDPPRQPSAPPSSSTPRLPRRKVPHPPRAQHPGRDQTRPRPPCATRGSTRQPRAHRRAYRVWRRVFRYRRGTTRRCPIGVAP